ncbi:MAG: hypothetical protein Q4D79_10585 [Propionibacteriaceae bacterium]|nr:hypothetical protein [Propionibacteriaceae bacterium]
MTESCDISSILGALEPAAGAAARHNARVVVGLFEQVRDAAYAAGITDTELGSRLGVSAPEARRILLGEVDITLTDLELILAAINARVRIDVTSAKINTEVRADHPVWLAPRSTSATDNWQQAPEPKVALA